MSLSVNSMLSSYTSTYNNQLYRGVDRNKDGAFSKQEVNKFAADYEESTGVKLDVEGLFKAYDVDVNGALSGEEYKKVVSDDAMGMSALYGETQEEPVAQETQSSGSSDISWLADLNLTEKNSLVQSTFRAETTGNLLNAMFGSINLFSMNNAIAQYTNTKMYNSAQFMNTMFSSINVLL